jgi:hypothetical protein
VLGVRLIAAFAALDLTPRLTLLALTALPWQFPVRAVATQTGGLN